MTIFAMLLVPEMTQPDFTGPYEVFARCPQAEVQLVWKTKGFVRTELGRRSGRPVNGLER